MTLSPLGLRRFIRELRIIAHFQLSSQCHVGRAIARRLPQAPRDIRMEMDPEIIEEDELVEITPDAIRMRKRLLREIDRRRLSRKRV